MKKRMLSLIVAVVFLVGLVACSNKTMEESSSDTETTESWDTSNVSATTSTDSVYAESTATDPSASNTGNATTTTAKIDQPGNGKSQ